MPDGEDHASDGYMPSWLHENDYREGQLIKDKYLKKYDGLKLEDALKGECVECEHGECYVMERSYDLTLKKIDREKARHAIMSNLRLIRGIGERKEKTLKGQGYDTIEDLLRHRTWKIQARKLIDILDGGDACCIQQELWRWLPKSNRLNLHVSAYCDMENIVAIDIETMGLFGRPIFLFGIASWKGDNLILRQFLARSIEEEPAAIGSFCSLMGNSPLLSYNGKAFDIPYIDQRRSYYNIGDTIGNVHFDMLPQARGAFRDVLPNVKLVTVEKNIFGHEREDDVPGILVPEFYETYLNTGNPGPLVPIIEHNRQDLVTLARIYSTLCEDCNGSGRRVHP